MHTSKDSYIVVGAGAFGASTARELRKAVPAAQVTLIDRAPFPHPAAASHDLNKIVRTDYENLFYMKLAIEAQHEWRNDPFYKPWYHESGIIYVENTGMGKNFMKNYRTLNEEYVSDYISEEEARHRFGGVFRDAEWSGVTKNYYNPRCGWGEGAAALGGLVQAAVDEGVTYLSSGVSKLDLLEDGTCRGVILENGEGVRAEHIILATGAWTPWLLAESAPNNTKVHAGDRIIATGAVQCRASFPADQASKFEGVPVLVNYMSPTLGESIPPDPEGKLKLNYSSSFYNKEKHPASGLVLSVPPAGKKLTTWSQNMPQGLKDEVDRVVRHTYGNWIEGLTIEAYRTCWDAMTPNQDFIIGPHSHCKGLYVAAGGSFHSWKFMPILGRYVVKMLKGELEPEMARRWAWDRENIGGTIPKYIPKRDIKDVPGYDKIED